MECTSSSAGARRSATRAGALGDLSQLPGKRIAHVDGASLFVLCGDVAHPARDRERMRVDRKAQPQPVLHGGEQPLRQFLRAVHRDLPGAVMQGGIGKALQQRCAVGRNIGAFRHRQRRRRVEHHLSGKRCKANVGHGGRDGLMAGEIAEIGQRRVAGVEQPQFHVLERRHIRDHLHACGREIRPSGRKAIFDDPLREWLGHHRPRVGHAERGGNL